MAPYTLRNQHFTCEDWLKLPNGKCPITTGEEALDLYHLNKNPEMNLMALGICTIVYRGLVYVILKMVKERWLGRLWRRVGGKKGKTAGVRQVETVEGNA